MGFPSTSSRSHSMPRRQPRFPFFPSTPAARPSLCVLHLCVCDGELWLDFVRECKERKVLIYVRARLSSISSRATFRRRICDLQNLAETREAGRALFELQAGASAALAGGG